MEFLGLRFLAPGFLGLLVLPLAALWLGARGGAVIALVTGTLESWRAAERNRPAEVKRKRRVPPALVCLAAALACGALALARPVRVGARVPRRFTLVVDRGPAMYLAEAGRTRLERALEPVRGWIAREVRAGDELVWIDATHPQGRLAAAPPAELLEAPRAVLAAPDWPRYDRADALWIGARFDPPPVNAGFSASGGGAVPGPIARERRARLDWDGVRVVRVEDAFAQSALSVTIDPKLPAPLRELAQLWAEQNGLVSRAARGADELCALELECAGAPQPAELAHEGWSAAARVCAPLEPAAGESVWLSSAGACVLRAPGLVRTSIAELAEPSGDPAAFAVSWGRLFDSVLLAPPGIVALNERTARGAPAWRAPASQGFDEQATPQALAGWLALLAALLALGAWVLRGIRA